MEEILTSLSSQWSQWKSPLLINTLPNWQCNICSYWFTCLHGTHQGKLISWLEASFCLSQSLPACLQGIYCLSVWLKACTSLLSITSLNHYWADLRDASYQHHDRAWCCHEEGAAASHEIRYLMQLEVALNRSHTVTYIIISVLCFSTSPLIN